MQLIRALLIIVSIAIAAYFLISLEIWAIEFKDMFFYLGDWRSWIALFALLYAIKGLVGWVIREEIILTTPRRRRR